MIALIIERPTTIKTIITQDCHTYKHDHMIAILTNTSTRSQLLQRRLQQRQPLLMTDGQRQQRQNNKHQLLLRLHASTQVLPPCRLAPGAIERLGRSKEIKPKSTGAPMDPARLGRCVNIKPKSTRRKPSVREAPFFAGTRFRVPTHVLRACHLRVGIAHKLAVRREERQGPRYIMRGDEAIANAI